MFPADQYRLAGQLADVYAPDFLEAEQSFAFVCHQHEADFVHVGGKHHTQGSLAGTFF